MLVIGGSISGADVPGLCERLRAISAADDAEALICDVSALVDPDAGTVAALARLQLAARRLGRSVRLRDASPELRELLRFMGLDSVLPSGAGLGLGPVRQAEEREEPRRVEEGMELDDPAA